jgi:hypothetical protein
LKGISEITAAIKSGSITLVIQDGRMIQIEKEEKKEKIRMV